MENNGSAERMDRVERSIEALAFTAAGYFSQLAEQQTQHEARTRDIQAAHQNRLNEIEAAHQSRLNDHEDAIFDVEAEHRRLLRAQVIIADELREAALLARQSDAKLNALIAVVDDFIRRKPKT